MPLHTGVTDVEAPTAAGDAAGIVAGVAAGPAAEAAAGAEADEVPAAPSPPALSLRDLRIVLPGGTQVGPIDLDLPRGEQLLVLGPSGSGKSTLLRVLAGAIPDHWRGEVHGVVRVAGQDPVALGVHGMSRLVGHLGQDPADGLCMPVVADDVALPAESRALPPGQITTLVTEALDRTAALHVATRNATELSGGEQQRVATSAATVTAPALLLLDEPTAMLDVSGILGVRRSVDRALAENGSALVLIEHRLDEWSAAGERCAGNDPAATPAGLPRLPGLTLALDADGQVLAVGPTREVLTDHRDALLAVGCRLPSAVQLPSTEPRGQHREATSVRPSQGPSPEAAQDSSQRPPRSSAVLSLRRAVLGHGPSTAPPVLREVDLDLHAGRMLAIVGRNGAGKSTLLGALSRLDPLRGGQISGGAAALAVQRPSAQFVGSTVEAELAASGADSAQVAAMLDRLGLSQCAQVSPFRLSGGQQRRLSIAAMILMDRPVLLVDEPGHGLDAHATATVFALLREAAAAGRAVCLTTHDLASVAQADDVVVIADGHVWGPMSPRTLRHDAELLERAGLTVGGMRTAPPHPDTTAQNCQREATGTADASSLDPAEEVARRAAHARIADLAADPGGGRGPLGRRDPSILLGLLLALSIVCVALTEPLPLFGLYLLTCLGTMIGVRRGFLGLLRLQLPFIPFAVGLVVINALSRPGVEIWPDLPLRVTVEGATLGVALALRALVIGLAAVTVAQATDARRTVVSLHRHVRLPTRYAYALLAGRRLLDDLPARWRTITRAHRLRLPLRSDGTVRTLGVRGMVRCAFALLVDAIRSSERLAFALEVRGLGEPDRSIWRPAPVTWVDGALAGWVALAVVGVLLLL